MNETQTHFVASCPYCSTQLRIRRGFVGQHVQCKHCNETFVAKEIDGPATAASGETDPVHPLPPVSQPERVVVTCPNCLTALSIRRVYLGRQVRCKQCDGTFLASDLATATALAQEIRRDRNGKDTDHSALQSEVDRLSSENSRLRDECRALSTDRERDSKAFEQLKAEFDRQEQEANQVREERDRATTELEAIRAHLGEIEPASVRPLFEERASLVAEIDRLRDAIQLLSDEQSERDRHREQELIAARADVDRLTALLERGESDLEAARAERDRLDTDRGRAVDEAEQLRIEGDRLRSEVEGLRRALEDAEQRRRDDVDRLDSELADVAEQRRQLHEHHEALEQSCKELRERNQELQTDLDQFRWAVPAQDSHDELQAARDEIESLKRKLDLADRLQREMAGILGGMGIKLRQI